MQLLHPSHRVFFSSEKLGVNRLSMHVDIGHRYYPRFYLQKLNPFPLLDWAEQKALEKQHMGTQWAASPGTSTCWAQQYTGLNITSTSDRSHIMFVTYIYQLYCILYTQPKIIPLHSALPSKCKAGLPGGTSACTLAEARRGAALFFHPGEGKTGTSWSVHPVHELIMP